MNTCCFILELIEMQNVWLVKRIIIQTTFILVMNIRQTTFPVHLIIVNFVYISINLEK